MAENRSRWDFSKEGAHDSQELRYNIGVPGPRGRGIRAFEVNDDGTITIRYSDNTSKSLTQEEMAMLISRPVEQWLDEHPDASITVQIPPTITPGEIEAIVNSITIVPQEET